MLSTQYIGCYNDDGLNRDFSSYQEPRPGQLTIDNAIAKCTGLGYAYAATQVLLLLLYRYCRQ